MTIIDLYTLVTRQHRLAADFLSWQCSDWFCPSCTNSHILQQLVSYHIHSLQVKVVLSNGLPPLVVLGGQEAIGQPQRAMFVFLLGSEDPQHQYNQKDDHRHPDQVWQDRGFKNSRTGVWRARSETYISFSLPSCYIDLFKWHQSAELFF